MTDISYSRNDGDESQTALLNRKRINKAFISNIKIINKGTLCRLSDYAHWL